MYGLRLIDKNIQEIVNYIKAIDRGDLGEVQGYIEYNKINVNDNIILPFKKTKEFRHATCKILWHTRKRGGSSLSFG